MTDLLVGSIKFSEANYCFERTLTVSNGAKNLRKCSSLDGVMAKKMGEFKNQVSKQWFYYNVQLVRDCFMTVQLLR